MRELYFEDPYACKRGPTFENRVMNPIGQKDPVGFETCWQMDSVIINVNRENHEYKEVDLRSKRQ